MEAKNMNGNLLLVGKRGLGKEKAAEKRAAEILNVPVEKLSSHPDFLKVSPKGTTFGVEELSPLQEFASFLPAKAEKKVCILMEAQAMSDAAQNSLLKILEDKTELLTVILIVEEGGLLLDTIASRCRVIQFSPLSAEELEDYCKEQGLTMDHVVAHLSEGCPGFYEDILKDAEYLKTVKDFCTAYCGGSDPKELFRILHLLKENDKDSFFEKYKDRQQYVLAFLQLLRKQIFTVKLVQSCGVTEDSLFDLSGLQVSVGGLLTLCEQITKDITSIRQKSYNKNDFFALVCLMAQSKNAVAGVTATRR